MAERLPSPQWFRDHAGVMLNDTDEEGMEEWAIVAAWASGRLVDREAIDYEAAYDRFDAILARPEPVTADTIMANLDSIINAALGEV